MKTIIALILLLPCYAMAGEDVRIVRCTDGSYAVQDYRGLDIDCSGKAWNEPCELVQEWRTIHGCPLTEAAARRLKQEELADRNRPPAPSVLYPIQVVE